MELTAADPDDPTQMQELNQLLELCREVDEPFEHPRTADVLADELRYGWDLEPARAWIAHDAGRPVAHGGMSVSEWDNRDVAWLGVHVHPAHRGRGLGSEVVSFLEEQAQRAGRTVLGTDAWDESPGVGFAVSHRYEKRSQAVLRRQTLPALDLGAVQAMRDEAMGHAPGYELLRLHGPVPDELIAAYCDVAASINDAPLDDLELEDDEYNPQRMRDHETALAGRRLELYRVLARHRETGELGGHTAMIVEQRLPGVAYQEDTAVAPAHRGRRLGLALKTDMMLWLAEATPQVRTVDTWNTESNHYMIAINEALGYRAVARELQFQKHA